VIEHKTQTPIVRFHGFMPARAESTLPLQIPMALALVPTIFQRPFEVNEECPAPIWNIEHGAPSILDIRQVARVYAELIGWLC
jgi:hypothetical protein